MPRGVLRVYLGAAPGVGKTYAMLGEGHRRRERGGDVVVGVVETHARPHTAAMLEGLEVVPRSTISYRGAEFTELDVDAVIRRHPHIVLIDELAHTNVPGSEHEKRWEDVEQILDAGIDVITTVNIQHLESLNDVVTSITGITQQETVPDAVVRRADQIELVDMAPEALRRRLAHGNVYASEKVDAALSNYFRIGNLTALRELALLWVADRVDEGLERYRAQHGIQESWPARERIVVCLTGGPEGETILRRAARIASRASRGELLAVHISRGDGLSDAAPDVLAKQRVLTESLGGSFHQVLGDDVPIALLDFARGANATQLVVGSSRRSRWQRVVGGEGVGSTVSRLSGDLDVHVVPHEAAARGLRRPSVGTPFERSRLVAGWAMALGGPPALAAVLANTRGSHTLATELMLFLALTVATALVGGLLPALVCAVLADVALNYWFTPPTHTLTVAEPANVLALVVFVVVAVSVAFVVTLAEKRRVEAIASQNEAETLSMLAGTVLRGERALPALLDRMRETFGMESVALVRGDSPDSIVVLESSGDAPLPTIVNADAVVELEDGLTLLMRGRVLPAHDRRTAEAFAAQASMAMRQRELTREAREARAEAMRNQVRTSLLAAVSHDLRTPLAGIKTAVTGLRDPEVSLSAQDQSELLATIEDSVDRLDAVVANLLDMSRLQNNAVTPTLTDVSLDEFVPRALSGVPADVRVDLDLPDTLPLVHTDPGLLERAVANVVENAARFTPSGRAVTVAGSSLGSQVQLRVIDRGPGVPDADKERMFEAFERLQQNGGAKQTGVGVGLGLAVARGLVQAAGGSIDAEDTPGGGLTMVITLDAEAAQR
jgi:two-component system, OmpR family, sensor histidine kinase KdpD